MSVRYKMAIVAAVSDSAVLKANLLQSALIKQKKLELHSVYNSESANHAYNQGIDYFSEADIIIFVHQDVYIPKNWESQLLCALEHLKQHDPDWALLGMFGQTTAGQKLGHVWDGGVQSELGGPFSLPTKVQTLDELLLIVNTKHGLRFDQNLPGFHLYGTDLCTAATILGKNSYVIDAPVIHNSKRIQSLGGSYATAYRYLQKKWRSQLPLMAPCSPITRWGIRYNRIRFGLAYRRFLKLIPKTTAGAANAIKTAKELGYE